MKYITEIKRDTFFFDKGLGLLLTTEGNTQKLLDIIKGLDEVEVIDYGMINNAFVIPIFEDLILKNGDILIPNIHNYELSYYGKFDLDVEDLYSECEKQNIPVYLVSQDINKLS